MDGRLTMKWFPFIFGFYFSKRKLICEQRSALLICTADSRCFLMVKLQFDSNPSVIIILFMVFHTRLMSNIWENFIFHSDWLNNGTARTRVGSNIQILIPFSNLNSIKLIIELIRFLQSSTQTMEKFGKNEFHFNGLLKSAGSPW